MESKYYRPRIEEFRIGFEFEGLIKTLSWGEEPEASWLPITLGGNAPPDKLFSGQLLQDFTKVRDNLKFFRVKCIDREDIESFGAFVDTDRAFKRYQMSFIIPEKCSIDFFPETNNFRIGDREGYLFRGSLRNKSELKEILIQIGVLEDA